MFTATGFGPFGMHQINASWVAVSELAKLGIADDVDLVVQEVPVEYEAVKKMVPALWEKHKPSVSTMPCSVQCATSLFGLTQW